MKSEISLDTESRNHSSISAVAGVCVVISQVKTFVNSGQIDGMAGKV